MTDFSPLACSLSQAGGIDWAHMAYRSLSGGIWMTLPGRKRPPFQIWLTKWEVQTPYLWGTVGLPRCWMSTSLHSNGHRSSGLFCVSASDIVVDTSEDEDSISTKRSIQYPGGAATQRPRGQRNLWTRWICAYTAADIGEEAPFLPSSQTSHTAMVPWFIQHSKHWGETY